jgi:hypothetical protein
MGLIVCSDGLIERVIGAAIEVHRVLGNQLHFKRGLLINFHCRLLRDGIKRVSI